MAEISGLAHVTLSVRDADQSVEWYREVLGFTVAAAETTPQWRRTLCLHPGSGLDHLAFRVDTHEELLVWQQRFQELGVDFTPIASTSRGGLAITFRDPDGIALELFHRPDQA